MIVKLYKKNKIVTMGTVLFVTFPVHVTKRTVPAVILFQVACDPADYFFDVLSSCREVDPDK